MTNHNFVMRRFLFWLVPSTFRFGFAFLASGFALAGCSGGTAPFEQTYPLPNGAVATVKGNIPSDTHGPYSIDYTLSLHIPGRKEEIVATSTAQETNGGETSDLPAGPFHLESQGKFWLLSDGISYYTRPKNGGKWVEHYLWGDRNLAFWGRAIMPDRYAQNEKFGDESGSEAEKDRLPDMPTYLFERWNEKKRLVVLRIASPPLYFDGMDKYYLLWPRRLVFEDWKFSISKTLALEPKWKLRPFPRGVKLDLIALAFAKWDDRPDYFLVEGAAQARRLMWKKTLPISASTFALPLQRWWTQKGPTTLQIRGVCADPNPQLLHFQWRIGQGEWFWMVAHQNQQLEIREPDGSALQSPYLYARFRWPKAAAKVGHNAVRPQNRSRAFFLKQGS